MDGERGEKREGKRREIGDIYRPTDRERERGERDSERERGIRREIRRGGEGERASVERG